MIYHILNGDGLAEDFDLEGEKIICREVFIDGYLRAKNLDEFWQVRADFIKTSYGGNSYFEKVKTEFDKLDNLQIVDEVNLWFGNEAFCQVNLWFILWLNFDKETKFYRVFPDSNGWNCSFNDLNGCLKKRERLTNEDLQLGKQLWKSYCFQDFESLIHLSKTDSICFPKLSEVCQALVEKDSKPKRVLSEIKQSGETDFTKIFLQFKEKAGIYGFGDLQVKNILASI